MFSLGALLGKLYWVLTVRWCEFLEGMGSRF